MYQRFIPARAGNTLRPRSVRGTVIQYSKPNRRFIPARAGNTFGTLGCLSPVRLASSTESVHPRACGEHLAAWSTSSRVNCARTVIHRFIPARAGNTWGPIEAIGSWTLDGSSPRVRGTRHTRHESRVLRFIPARAGNTRHRAPSSGARPCPVHPRACGEHGWHTTVTNYRFIPARAGMSIAQ